MQGAACDTFGTSDTLVSYGCERVTHACTPVSVVTYETVQVQLQIFIPENARKWSVKVHLDAKNRLGRKKVDFYM